MHTHQPPRNYLDNGDAQVIALNSFSCATCSFALWHPVFKLDASFVGLYSDERFPGRCIVSMRDHYSQIDEVPGDALTMLMRDVQLTVSAIRQATGCARVNVAILGNAESHVHAHLIPRFPERELRPRSSPWDDPRERLPLVSERAAELVSEIGAKLSAGRPKRRRARRSTGNTIYDGTDGLFYMQGKPTP